LTFIFVEEVVATAFGKKIRKGESHWLSLLVIGDAESKEIE
jgi:hypothetical protein